MSDYEQREAAWEAWTPRLTDLSKPAPAYREAFDAAWDAKAEPGTIDREDLRVAIGGVLHNASNFPERAQSRLLGQDMAPLIDRTTDAVVARLAAQPVTGTTERTVLILSSNDPEPPVGTIVVTPEDGVWQRFDSDRRGWAQMGSDNDTESWTRVAGNYGPVRVLGREAAQPATVVTYGLGDPDPTPNEHGVEGGCEARRGPFFCTWGRGHTGQHVAGNGSTIAAVWF